MLHNTVVIFTDGSSRGNPGPGGFGAVVILPGQNGKNKEVGIMNYEVKEIGGRAEHTTNNRMELTAAIQALSFASSHLTLNAERYTLFSDSSYLINGITKWTGSWQKNGWRTKTKQPVENQDLWKELAAVTSGKSINWRLIGGHIGVAGNERSDELATSFADGLKPKLYSGALENYPVKNILRLPATGKKTSTAERSVLSKPELKRGAKAYSYVSAVDGVAQIHKTWAECEKRVKGKSSARFKKVFSADEESALIHDWS